MDSCSLNRRRRLTQGLSLLGMGGASLLLAACKGSETPAGAPAAAPTAAGSPAPVAPDGKGPFKGIDITGAEYARDFSLPDSDGKVRTLAEFRGKVVLMFFGFTQCPDVCPTTLTNAVEVRRLLGAEGERVQVVFVTIDPERDTPEILGEYVHRFDPSFIALRGTMEQTRDVSRAFKVFYMKVPTGESYTMDHTALSYVFDPAGRIRLALRYGATAEDNAADIRRLLAS